ncbi:MAG TPA: 5'-3' exonuclease [Actinomycetota bacterium]|nr:5'-3' exonuclease [Actinomycetota bacterium]
MTHRLLLDTSSLLYRAFFAIPATITDRDGRPVNAVRGYLDMTAALVRNRNPDEVVHVYDDDWRPAERVAAYAGYKASRPAEPPEITDQLALLREVLDLLGMAQASAPGWEAEDAIGTLAARARARDRIEVVTGDRDLIQLVRDPTVRLLFTRRGVSELDELDEAAVLERYGIAPDRYADLAILRGDPSDGLPGVRGVGPKTATALVAAYPDLNAMLEDAEAERAGPGPLRGAPGLKARLRGAAEYIEAMRRVVPIRTELEVSEWRGEPDAEALERTGERRAIAEPVRRLREALEAQRTPRRARRTS